MGLLVLLDGGAAGEQLGAELLELRAVVAVLLGARLGQALEPPLEVGDAEEAPELLARLERQRVHRLAAEDAAQQGDRLTGGPAEGAQVGEDREPDEGRRGRQ